MTSELEAIAITQDWSQVYDLADAYKKQGQWQHAAVAFQRTIELNSDFFWSYHHLGDVLIKLQQWQQAAKAYSMAVKLDPSFFWSWHNLGDALTKLQQWQQAAKAYSMAVKLDPSFFWSWHNLGDALTKLRQWDGAIANYLQAIYLQPEHQLIYHKLGVTFKQRGALKQSIKDYRQLILTPPPHSVFQLFKAQPQRLINLADTLVKQHQTSAAIIIYSLVLDIQPAQTEVKVRLAQLLKQQGQLKQAIARNQQKITKNTAASQLLTQAKTTPQTKSSVTHISGRILIESNGAISSKQLNDLWLAVGWSSRSLDKLERALKSSFRYVSATHVDRQGKQLIGFARAISDGVYHATLVDIAVHPDFQGKKVGKNVVQTLIKQLHQAQIGDITLFASPHLVDFYHKLGFLSQPNNLQWMLWCPTADKL